MKSAHNPNPFAVALMLVSVALLSVSIWALVLLAIALVWMKQS